MQREPLILKRQRRGHTLAVDTANAARFEALASDAIAGLLDVVPEDQRGGLARAIVQEAVRADAEVRGSNEAAAWASKLARVA